MLGFGLLGEIGFKENWLFVNEGQLFDLRLNEFKIICGMIATGFMSQLFIRLSGNLDQTKVKLFTRVLLLWCFYPIVYFMSESLLTLVLFSVVDLMAKVGIGLTMHNEYEIKRT
jgi:bacteriorhodopsin